MASFNPNTTSFADGIKYIDAKSRELGFKLHDKIVTSRDPGMERVKDLLDARPGAKPNGFNKWALPVYFEEPVQLYLSFGAPLTKVDTHSHDEGDGIRVIMGGSMVYEGKELTAGDWMYIPKGESYAFEVGPMGVSMMYCYQCCCAGWVVQ